ncbi:exonuclease mut-7 homolog isoform X8 [Prionailurus viverrinus]|uniref:exonuclease mut-7 homolog isoform X8 n=1 Tax=Prionailurus viverrinus TaxID=61388 RepID=UPI001FF51D91|nr:exonuclease mut-7 homolog isoform X8 [Prionailurus viverrinus]
MLEGRVPREEETSVLHAVGSQVAADLLAPALGVRRQWRAIAITAIRLPARSKGPGKTLADNQSLVKCASLRLFSGRCWRMCSSKPEESWGSAALRMDPADPPGDPAAGDPAAGDTDPAGNSTGSERRCTGQDPLLFRQALQTLWSTRELWQLREEAWRGFAALDDPLTGLLDVLEGSQAWQRKGPSLEAWVVCELHRWLQARPLPASAQHSSRLQQLQARAVRVLARSPPSLVEPLVSIFQLQDADRSPLLTHIHQLHQEGKFKEAVVLGSRLKLQPALDVEKMCTPLLLQDRVSLVERYVAGFPDLQRRLLALLDSWCRPGFDIGVVARQHPQVTSRLERLSPRVLSRRVLSQLERLGLDPALCPNAATQQRLAALRYLCYKRFVERSMSQENWVDHVQMRVVNMPAGGTYESRGLRGLSLLVQQVLGKPLDKTQQLSNWDRRPLSEGQLVYAAADAYCLLEVHQALSREPASFSLSEDLARSLQPGCSERPGAREPPRLQEASALPWQVPVAEREDTTPEVPARAFRVVCDNMLQGLARSLRCLGADVRVLGTNEDHRRAAEARTCTRTCEIRTEAPVRPEAVAPPPWFPCSPFLLPPGPSSAPASAICLWHSWQRAFRGTPPESAPATGPLPGFFALAASTAAWSCAVARQEGRIILTSGLPYHKLRDQVGAGRCLWVDCSLKARQQAKAVLRHFNVRVTHADIFSRCQACNCDQYLKVSKDTMKQLVRLSSCPEGPSITRDEATQSEDIQEAGSAPEEAPGGCTYDPPCRWLEAADLRAGAPATLASGTRLQLAGVPEGVLRRPGLRHFYCCSGCGKVFWEGSHLCRVTSQFSQILSSASSSWKQS